MQPSDQRECLLIQLNKYDVMSKQNISISNRTDMREYVNKRDNSRQAQKKKICEASKKLKKVVKKVREGYIQDKYNLRKRVEEAIKNTLNQ